MCNLRLCCDAILLAVLAYHQLATMSAGCVVTPKHLCQIYQAWLMLQLKPAALTQYMQPPALLQMCQQV